MSITVRAVTAPEASSLRSFAISLLGDSSYAEPLISTLESAIAREGDDYRALVADDAGALVGVIVFGETAGARGAGRISLVGVEPSRRRRGVATQLLQATCVALRDRGCRFVAVELPTDSRYAAARALVEGSGFREEGRIDDYLREGVALALLRRDLT
ncbi:MAG: GNAT family N-acetyltransferase [Gemmatimonadaceae bacterium]